MFEVLVMVREADTTPVCKRCQSTHTERMASMFAFNVAAKKFDVKRGPKHNAYGNLTLQNVRDEGGKPLTVHSEAELHAAEKRYNFVHAASWGMENEPPQHEKWAGDLTRGYTKKWNKDPAAYTPDQVAKVELGGTLDPNETLAPLPNSTREIGA